MNIAIILSTISLVLLLILALELFFLEKNRTSKKEKKDSVEIKKAVKN
ncbi:hypothetical protein J4477_02475 [Candidatus Pacearchaeota archaeon]|nr:hypothetical protein [Candidatus Pacearchaeota archaeon]